jgi:hypothetical protein
MMMAQLFLPMLIVLTVAVCFVVVRRRRGAALDALEEPEEEKSEIPGDRHR